MNTRYRMTLGLAAFGFIVCGAVRADVSIEPHAITHGTTITVTEPGPDLSNLLDGIVDASAENPYLVKLGAGNFQLTQQLVLKPYVYLSGSGIGATRLTGDVSGTSTNDSASALVLGADNTALTDLSVENTGTGDYKIGIKTLSGEGRYSRLHVTVSGSTVRSYGLRIQDESKFTDVSIVASGSGGTNYGVITISEAGPVLNNVETTVSGGTINYGLSIASSLDTPLVRNSYFKGDDYGARISSEEARIMDTIFDGGLNIDPTGTQCRGVFDELLNPISC